METEPKRRDHRDEHEGCNVSRPCYQGCRRHWYVEGLIATATEDVKRVPEEERELWMRNVISQWKRYGAPSKWTLKSQNASNRDRWREDELRHNLRMVKRLAELAGDEYLGGLTVEAKAEQEWTLRIQRMALEILVRGAGPGSGGSWLIRPTRLPTGPFLALTGGAGLCPFRTHALKQKAE